MKIFHCKKEMLEERNIGFNQIGFTCVVCGYSLSVTPLNETETERDN